MGSLRKAITVRPTTTKMQEGFEEARAGGGGIQAGSHPEMDSVTAGFKNPLSPLFHKRPAVAQPTMSAEDTSYVQQGQKYHYDSVAKIAMNRRARNNG